MGTPGIKEPSPFKNLQAGIFVNVVSRFDNTIRNFNGVSSINSLPPEIGWRKNSRIEVNRIACKVR